MRSGAIIVGSLAALLLGAGCAGTGSRSGDWSAAEVIAVPVADARVTVVNEEFHFAVLEFRAVTMPPVGTVLDVYRDDRPVGQVRVTEPARGAFTTADILRGAPQAGDRVRAAR